MNRRSVRRGASTVFLLIGCLLQVSISKAQDKLSRMEQIIQSSVTGKRFMGSVLVAQNDQVLLDKGYGYANLEWQIPDSPQAKFRLGSITKQFTAACILLLEERGKLKTDDPVKKYMPDAPAAWDKITIYNLLTHTSGIPSFTVFLTTVRPKHSPQHQKNWWHASVTNRWNSSREKSGTTAIPDMCCWGIWWRRSVAKATKTLSRKTSSSRWE